MQNFETKIHKYQARNQMDNTKFYTTYEYDEFIVEFLRLLEPQHFEPGQTIFRQNHFVNDIYFLADFEI